ncbi:hypothetical protein M3Y99_01167100 [Aphelenchoides fujianensis]|nr:hypothetical protein M3Y99_01167100 [Aphelenchoides fujianensis]
MNQEANGDPQKEMDAPSGSFQFLDPNALFASNDFDALFQSSSTAVPADSPNVPPAAPIGRRRSSSRADANPLKSGEAHGGMPGIPPARVHPICGKRFKARGGFKQHALIHQQERNFACRYCSKTFIQKGHCVQHERIHLNEKPYNCQFCNRAFRQRSQQLSHEQTHGNRPQEVESKQAVIPHGQATWSESSEPFGGGVPSFEFRAAEQL